MPSSTPQQAKVMSAIAHGWKPKGKAAGIPVKVAKEFHAADKGKKWGAGGKKQDGGRICFQSGGGVPFVERMAFYHMPKSGFINSAVPGRTDKHGIQVAAGSYVLPADHVSALGQNNSLAGSQAVKRMFGPGGKFGPRIRIPRFAGGGGVDVVPIVVAGGEHILPPELVRRVGNGDLEKGFDKLDQWVLDVRKKHIEKLKGLAPPKKK